MLGVYVNAFRSRCEFGKNFENWDMNENLLH
jgi:hypothetical protein